MPPETRRIICVSYRSDEEELKGSVIFNQINKTYDGLGQGENGVRAQGCDLAVFKI